MNRPSSLRFRLVTVTVIFLLSAPALGLIFNSDQTKDIVWAGLLVGALALALGWFGWGDNFFRQTNALSAATKRLASGNLDARTGLAKEPGELGELAGNIDTMADAIQRLIKEREQVERTLLNRTHQQTVVAALGQFAMVSDDFSALLDQAVNFIGQTLEIEYTGVWEMDPDGQTLKLRAGTGWKSSAVGTARLEAGAGTLISHMFTSVEPLIIEDLPQEKKFIPPAVLADHGVVSCATTIITGGTWPFGVLCVGATRSRKFTEDEIHFLIATATVIAMSVNRRQTEAQLRKLAEFAQLNPNPAIEFDVTGNLVFFNDAAMTLANNLSVDQPRDYLPKDYLEVVKECLSTGKSRTRFETQFNNRILSWSFFPIAANNAIHCYVNDITERANLEAQLRQSQKMESIGQLAAGVAHDFNNMLTIIQGHSGVIMARTEMPPPLLDSAQAIYFAAERAASLTRQLLMFSRKNLAQPKLLDLKEVVGHMTKMLQRLLGEQVVLDFHPPATLPSMRGDTGMMEQVIMNLAVNARDAMIKGGKLTIQLSALDLDRGYVQLHPQARPGQFIRLTVTDTGQGMTPEIQGRIFEPFFTTKDVGKGTGLGLATVYGIVKQHEGWIELMSEVGKGTTFEVYFPASAEKIDSEPVAAAAISTRTRGGSETVLVVEDEPVIRDLAHLILKEHGYRVLEAASGVEALVVWEKERENIDLLLTDMVMPEGMTGRELADKLKAERPDLKVICASGYSVEDINQTGIVFLPKPYTRLSLAKTIRDTLDK